MKIADIITLIEGVAPLSWQESYDNSGVQVGEKTDECTGVLLCIDVTLGVVLEARELGCNLIISHHPVLFKGLKSITGKSETEQIVMNALRNRIVLYAAHTNMDNAPRGVNDKIAQLLGLQNCRILAPMQGVFIKLSVFVPQSHEAIVKRTLFEAGAGEMGNYKQCAYTIQGRGQYEVQAGANPYVGAVGVLHQEEEVKIEVILPTHLKSRVVAALLKSHPYEEPAFDLIPLLNDAPYLGSGVVGELPEAMDEARFLALCKKIFCLPVVKHSVFRGESVKKVALCGGSGSFLIPQAIACGADVFVTGEIKYHDYFGRDKQILLAEMGHYETEQYTKDIFCEIITNKFPTFAIHFTKEKTNPINYF